MAKKTSRQLQAEQTRERIFNVVKEFMRQKVIDKVTIRDICAKAEVSLGTFYLYFPCKEAAILYCQRIADEAFTNLALGDNPLDNIEFIIRTQFELIDEEYFSLLKQICICHLTYYDEYYLSESRPLFVELQRQIALLKKDYDEVKTKELTWKVLDMTRGFIYNLCIRQNVDISSWREMKIKETIDYLRFLLY